MIIHIVKDSSFLRKISTGSFLVLKAIPWKLLPIVNRSLTVVLGGLGGTGGAEKGTVLGVGANRRSIRKEDKLHWY